ncbi:MAG: hypothetical protein WBG50_13490 [Desulfomonilaceae bacterium]
MEFWIGLSVGMHLGRVIAENLEKIVKTYGILSPTTCKEIGEIEAAEGKISSLVDEELTED